LSLAEIQRSHDLLGQAVNVVTVKGGPDLRGHLDLAPLWNALAAEGAFLGPEELLLVKEEALSAQNAKLFFRSLEDLAPGLYAQTLALGDFTEFIASVDHCLSPEGELLDSASPALKRLREEAILARDALTDKLLSLARSQEFANLTRDAIVTVRQDRFVIPVRASGAGKSRGLVHDWSQSGATAYLEPLEAIDDNNRLAFLKKQETLERERILRDLSRQGKEAAASLRESGEILTGLDLILAEARLAARLKAVAPIPRPGEGYDLKGLRHPLLETRLAARGGAMTPLDIAISPQAPLLVISGLNAGGKTVALKTLGLNVLLAKTGLFVLARPESSMDVPDRVLTVMGDNQDLASDLSTFSAHVRALVAILQAALPGSLILLDELGNGTDPQEGAALALATLEHLKDSGATVLAATHFHQIKTWAALTPGAVPVAVNSTVAGEPSFGLSYGSPGFSGGIHMAQRLGLPDFLTQKAQSYLEEGHSRSLELLRKLEEERAALAREREALRAERQELGMIQERDRRERARALDKLQAQAQAGERELKTALARHRREWSALKREIQEKSGRGEKIEPIGLNIKVSGLARNLETAKGALAAAAAPEEAESAPPLAVTVGARVWLKKLRKPGVILAWDSEREEGLAECGSLSVKTRLAELGALKGERRGEKETPFLNVATSQPRESLKLIGMTVDEAIVEIDREIDLYLLNGRASLTLIHGLGTGRLRDGIWDYLRTHPKVLKYQRPLDRPGGLGITEITLDV
jgi:DNA mismatch repair protein MutS2